jgi:hypothetical protein
MSFIVEDGVHPLDDKNANAYCTKEFANAYHEDFGDPAAWSGADDSDKEAAIRTATRYLDATYTNRWVAEKVSRRQSLSWPRYYDGYINDELFYADEIPLAIKQATAILALNHINGEALFPVKTTDDTLEEKLIKVSDITIAKKFSGGGAPVLPEFPLIDALLTKLLKSASRVTRR